MAAPRMATLLRVDLTQALLHNDYDERASLTTDTKTRKKWAEYTVVLQATKLLFYTSNKAAASSSSSPALTIPLPGSQVSLFSPLDKTLSITRRDNITSIYYLRAQTTATAVEWYTKLRELTGHERAKSLEIKIPDLNASLRLDDPFKGIKRNADPTTETCAAENNIAGDIIARCTEMLKQSPEWTDVLNGWLSNGKIGLAWKRYDRLEWISGALEHNMYGTIAMARNYDLELRPQIHYPTTAKLPNGETMKEPAPIEGFLIRLTSQKGQERRFGKMMYKRLYFHTKNQYLLFCKPGKAIPPTSTNGHIRQNEGDGTNDNPHSDQNAPNHGIVPYSINDDTNVTDGHDGAQLPHNQQSRERDNAAESERNMSLMLSSKGFIYLCDVKNVRTYTDGATPADENIDDGPDVDFHDMEDRDDRREHDGSTTEVDQDRILELALKNGLVIRLQASNKATRNEWMRRLRQLVEYWTQRTKADMDLYKTVRDQNLKELGIDERTEAGMGQFAYKWEVSQAYASPALYNMCGISRCRTVHVSGTLFRKPRRHTTFERCHVILSHGHLHIFQDALRKNTGKKLLHIHHDRLDTIDLKPCYVYSGLLTDNDLLYSNQTFDSNTPGRQALPKIYLEDNWTSSDEDASTTFVIWGKGNTVVFKARSRAEKDHWVLAVQAELALL